MPGDLLTNFPEGVETPTRIERPFGMSEPPFTKTIG